VYGIEHLELKIVLKKCVKNLEPNANLAGRGAVNQTWNRLQPLTNSRAKAAAKCFGSGAPVSGYTPPPPEECLMTHAPHCLSG
jgi:hypothetical protein